MNNESFDDLLNRLNNQEKQQVIEYAYMFDDLRYLREHDKYLQKQLEAYENMRKEIIEFIESMEYCGQEDYFYDKKAKDPCGNDNTFDDSKNKLLNILNKVGEDNE